MNVNPYVRCVGIGTHVYQSEPKKAYDHRLICVLKGSGLIYIEKDVFPTEPCQLYFIDPGKTYRVCSEENQDIAVINFDTTYEYSHLSEPIVSDNSESFRQNDLIKTERIPFVRDRMYLSYDELRLVYQLYDAYLRCDIEKEVKDFYLSSQLSYLIARATLNGFKETRDEISLAIYKYVIENAHEGITLSGTAKHFNYSESFVEKKLRKNYNTSFRQLVIDTRVKKAVWLLENTSLSCAEVSSRLGFSSVQHFSSTIMKKYGKRPSDFR